MSISRINFALFFLGLLLFLPNLGQVPLFDWDEINFAESAREMIVSGDYLHVTINFQPFWEKPPLFMWLQALSMKVFGVNAFAARFPNAIVGCVTLLSVFNIGRHYISTRFGLLWVAAFVGSFLPHFYFKSGIIDPLFNLFIFLSVFFFHRSISSDKHIHVFYSGVLMGLAILTKGPVALLISFLCLFLYVTVLSEWSWSLVLKLITAGLLSMSVAGSWLLIEIFQNGTFFIKEFWNYNIRLFNTEDSGHGQPIYYHPVVILIGCFPISTLAVSNLFSNYRKNSNYDSFPLLMQILFWVVLVIFSVVKTKIVHYSSLCYLPITFMGAYYIYHLIESKNKIPKIIIVSQVIAGVCISIVFIAIPLIPVFKETILPFIDDVFARENINYPVAWSGYEFVGGAVFLGLILTSLFFYKNTFKYVLIQFIAVVFMLQFMFYAIVPKLEQHIQGAMIDFLVSIEQEDCYVKALGYKTYAPLFYTKRKPQYHANVASENENWLMNGDIDKPVYFITKCDRDYYRLNLNLNVVLEAGGFVVYKREMK